MDKQQLSKAVKTQLEISNPWCYSIAAKIAIDVIRKEGYEDRIDDALEIVRDWIEVYAKQGFWDLVQKYEHQLNVEQLVSAVEMEGLFLTPDELELAEQYLAMPERQQYQIEEEREVEHNKSRLYNPKY